MVVDEPRIGPEEFKFTVTGHKHAYYLTTLRPYYGEAFCCHFRDAWTKASGLIRGTTAIKYFQSARTAFELIAYNGTAKPRSPEGYILRLLRDKPGSQIDEKRWHPVAINLSRAILTIGDNSFIESENPTSRNKKLEALNAGFKWLHQGGMIPDIPLEGRLETRNHDSSKCLATLAFENARFGIAGLSANDAYQAFLTMNVDMLEEVRRCLCADLMDNYDKFKLGKVLMSDSTVPEISDVEDTLIAAVRWQLRQGKGCAILGLTREQGWVLALKILKHRASGGKPLHENLFYFARSMVSHADAQPYFEATTRTLNAAFHIILIDVGGNSQPIEDIPFKCYKSKASRGKIVLRSLRLDKNRAGGKWRKKRVRGEIASTVEEIELILPTKHHADRPSGIAVIDMYKELTASMRSQSGPTHERLWVWRVAWEAKVHTSLASVGMERWQDFLDRNADNHLIGGLPLTRQILRTSVANTRGERGEIDWVSVFDAFDNGELKFEFNARNAIAAPPFARLLGIDDYRTFPKQSKEVIDRLLTDRELHVSRAPVRQGRTFKSPLGRTNSRPAEEDENSGIQNEASGIGGKLTRDAARLYYRVWLDLWRLRDKLTHDVIGYRAFKDKRALAHFMSKAGFPLSTPTEDAPARQTSCLINSALTLAIDPVSEEFIDFVGSLANPNVVLDHDVVERLNVRLVELGLARVKPVYYEHKGTAPEDTLTIHDFVFKVLPASARIIMAAYSARRDEELEKTKTDCVEVDSHGDHWLRCLINKNLNQVDRIPVPRSVARAVEIVSRIRALGGKPTEKLFDFACPVLKRPVKFDLGAVLDKVRDYFGVPLLDDGSAWHFKPHQFRKFFGVTYYWRWAFPDLTALTLQYRHFNPDTTRAYIEMKGAEALRMRDEKLAAAARQRDVERKKDFYSSQRDFVGWVLKGVAEGKRLAGAMGKRINEMVDDLVETYSAEIDITLTTSDEDSFDQALERLIDSVSMSTHPEGHSICCMGSKFDPMRHQQANSQCLQLRQRLTGTPSTAFSADLGFAEDSACAVCALRARLPEMMPYWDREARRANEALQIAQGHEAALLKDRVRIIKEFA
ncbi:hypothetical protein ELI49_24160 [Rhizobium ruizarguesonis]|uniref:hypothetical protein n=1 Tax=Rhizobium ruizarguesonis TaxID=2081791 RepID=UPI0010310072|nr:hypothetical protein [Rhizobium ruizarguesonis]TAU12634.1 hypothetical protein ELI49_24160 [Rhizobium ruizarguesonis]